MYTEALRGVEFEIVRIGDAQGLAEGYNRGLARSRGELLVFSHDDVEFLAVDFAGRLLGHMGNCDVLGVAGTRWLTGPRWYSAGFSYLYGQIATPSRTAKGKYVVSYWSAPRRRVDRMQALDGVFLCARREAAESVGFDERTFDGFHLYDLDFTYRAYQSGLRVSVACDLFPLHQSHGDFGEEWGRYAAAFVSKVGLPTSPSPPSTSGATLVWDKGGIIPAMTHSHWDD
jgi:GT2 family glycosyltransferase